MHRYEAAGAVLAVCLLLGPGSLLAQQTPRPFGPAASPVWSVPAPATVHTLHSAPAQSVAATSAGPRGGRIGLVIGAVAGGLGGSLLGRHLCLEASPGGVSCAGPMVVVGGVGALAGALVGYVIGAGSD